MSISELEKNVAGPVWWVLHSRPRCEKRIRDGLTAQGQQAYLPCRNSRRIYPSKSVTFTVPLFPGYVFAQICHHEKSAVLSKLPVAGVLTVVDQFRFQQQLEDLKRVLHTGVEPVPCPFIETGRRVKITSGKFKGTEGLVVRRSGKTRLILSIDILQQSVEVELEADLVALAA